MKDITAGVTNRECRAVIRRAIRAGCIVTITRSGHVRIKTPSGQVYFTGLTTSDRYVHRKIERALIRMGVEL